MAFEQKFHFLYYVLKCTFKLLTKHSQMNPLSFQFLSAVITCCIGYEEGDKWMQFVTCQEGIEFTYFFIKFKNVCILFICLISVRFRTEEQYQVILLFVNSQRLKINQKVSFYKQRHFLVIFKHCGETPKVNKR